MDPRRIRSPWLVALLVAALACRRTDTCVGAPTCFAAQMEDCRSIPGCAPTQGCVLHPIYGIDCFSPATEAECLATAGRGDCTWSAGHCGETCARITDRATCESSGSCLWSACTGRPKACRLYGPDECPVSPLGCYLDPDRP